MPWRIVGKYNGHWHAEVLQLSSDILFDKNNSEVIEILDVINTKSNNKIYISNEFEFFEN